MQIRPVIPLASVLAGMLASSAVEPFSAKLTATTKSVHVAQLPAPRGHRQPTMNDLPPSLREEDKVRHRGKPNARSASWQCRRRAKQSAKWATTNAEARARQWCSPNLRPLLTAPLTPPADRPPGVAGGRGMGDAEVVRQGRRCLLQSRLRGRRVKRLSHTSRKMMGYF